jgi:hypothetical protein
MVVVQLNIKEPLLTHSTSTSETLFQILSHTSLGKSTFRIIAENLEDREGC